MRRLLHLPAVPGWQVQKGLEPRLLVPAALIVAFAALRVLAAVHAPIIFPDTHTFRRLSFAGGSERLWTVPLLWTVFPTGGLREGAQVIIAIAAWSGLAVSVGASIGGRRWRVLMMAGVLLLGLVPQIAGWDADLLSESMSISLLVLVVALLLQLTRAVSGRWIFACLAVTTLWVFTRQTNVLIYMAMLPLLVICAVWRLRGKSRLLTVIGLVILGAWSTYAATRPANGAEWNENAVFIVTDRVAEHRSVLQYFERHGMPDVRLVLAQRGPKFHGKSSPLFRDPRFMHWINARFRRVYLSYLEGHPRTFLLTPLTRAPRYMTSSLSDGKARSVLPRPVQHLLWDRPSFLLGWLVIGAALLALARFEARRIRGLAVIGLLLAASIAGSILIWNATDPEMNLGRQFMPVSVALRLCILMAIAFSVDALLVSRGLRHSGVDGFAASPGTPAT